MSKEPLSYLVYGNVEKGEILSIGFRGFSFEMTKELHERLGILYEMILEEYRNAMLKVI